MSEIAATRLDRMAAVFETPECCVTIRVRQEGPTEFTVWGTATVSDKDRSPYPHLKDGSDTVGLLELWAMSAGHMMGDRLAVHAVQQDSEAKVYGSMTAIKAVTTPAETAELIGSYIASFAKALFGQ